VSRPLRPARIGARTAETIRFYAHTWRADDFAARKPRNLQRAAISRRGWFNWSAATDANATIVTDDAVAALRAYDHALATGPGARWYIPRTTTTAAPALTH
jgi:hypothetical protein